MPRVKIVIAAINVACLLVTLLVPSDITPFVLLTVISSVVMWAFTTRERFSIDHRVLTFYIIMACFLAIICIVLGITSSINSVDVGKYVVQFEQPVAGLAGAKISYMIFAIPMFLCISFLMVVEVWASFEAERLYGEKDVPITERISNCVFRHNP